MSAFRPISEVQEMPFEWIWKKWIPRAELTIIEGNPGTGKSTILNYIVAALTSSQVDAIDRLPGYLPDKPLDVLIIDTEQSIPTTLKPRLMHFRADLNRIKYHELDFGSENINVIDDLEEELSSCDYDIVIIDALLDVLFIDQNNQKEVTKALGRIRSLAREKDVAIVGVRHWAKAGHTTAVAKGSGSIKITGIARSVIAVAEHPHDPDKRLFASVKCSNGSIPDTLVFSIQGEPLPDVIWHGTTGLKANNLVDEKHAPDSRLDDAKEFLMEIVTSEGIRATTVFEEAKELGIAKRTLDRAKKELGVRADRMDGKWFWRLDAENLTP